MTPEGDKEFPNIDLFERCQAVAHAAPFHIPCPPSLTLPTTFYSRTNICDEDWLASL